MSHEREFANVTIAVRRKLRYPLRMKNSNAIVVTAQQCGPCHLGDSLTVRGRLALLGWASLTAWATAHGYSRQHTCIAIRVWGNPRKDSRRGPHGDITRRIVDDLSATLNEGRRPHGDQS